MNIKGEALKIEPIDLSNVRVVTFTTRPNDLEEALKNFKEKSNDNKHDKKTNQKCS